MASPPPSTTPNLPTIWLAPPAALLPPTHPAPLHPLPLATSATLTTLILHVLIILYRRHPRTTNPPARSTSPAPLRKNIPVPDPSPELTHPSRSPPHTVLDAQPFDRKTPANGEGSHSHSASASSPSQDASPEQDYHTYLKSSAHGPSPRDAEGVRSPPPLVLGYTGASYYGDVETASGGGEVLGAGSIQTAASSDYSVSIDPTPLPSRQSSLHRGQGHGAWKRLQLGSEYDGDRTFVPSEANLELGVSSGKAM